MQELIARIIAQFIVTAFLVVLGFIISKIFNLDERTTVTIITYVGTVFSILIIFGGIE